jgi:raffinose/stachyose/melibiose transport system substrate-binding protein
MLLVFPMALFASGGTEATGAGQAVTLKVNYEGGDLFPSLFQAFMKKYPNVKIEANVAGIEVMDSGQLKLALQAGTGPDLMQVDAAPARMGLLANAGLLLALDDYYSKLNWKFADWTIRSVTYAGKKYGIPLEVDLIGVNYNKKIYSRLGVGEPKAYEDYIAGLKKIKEGGTIPLTWGTAGCCQQGHYYAHYVEAAAGRQAVENLLYGNGKWTDAGFLKAAEELVRLVKEGYVNPDPNALKDAEARQLMWSGKAAGTITGNWVTGEIIKDHPDIDPGWYAVPPITAASKGGFTGGLGSGWAVSAKTKAGAQAADLLNFMFFTEEGQKLYFGGGNFLPTFPVIAGVLDKVTIHPYQKEVVEEMKDPRGIGYNLSVYVPANTKNTYYQVIQGWIGGKLSPQQGLAEIQKAWEKDIADGLVQK